MHQQSVPKTFLQTRSSSILEESFLFDLAMQFLHARTNFY
jgi:hypothetical protein